MINPEVTPEDQKQEEEELEVNMVQNLKLFLIERDCLLFLQYTHDTKIYRNTTKHNLPLIDIPEEWNSSSSNLYLHF